MGTTDRHTDRFIPEQQRKPLPVHEKKYTGTVYHDDSSKGWKNGKRQFHDRWVAEITINNIRYRHRSADRQDCEDWLRNVQTGRIKPSSNNADWMRMEQKVYQDVRYDEMIVSAAEEAMMLYDYHTTGDLTAINNYLVTRLLPHMTYYCCHNLHLGEKVSLQFAREAAALLLTRITAGRPVTNFTYACKRMLRVRHENRDFWYYETAPEHVKQIINGLDLSMLSQVWKVTKDKRLHR